MRGKIKGEHENSHDAHHELLNPFIYTPTDVIAIYETLLAKTRLPSGSDLFTIAMARDELPLGKRVFNKHGENM
jgi:hypothetical protein